MAVLLLSLLLLHVSGDIVQEFNLVKLIVINTYATWKNAQAYCRQHHTDLITFDNQEDVQRFTKASGWIGLFRENASGPWTWSHGNETANYMAWSQSEPKENHFCAYTTPNSDGWLSDFCVDRHTFTCFEDKLVVVQENKTWEEALVHCRSLRGGNANNLSSHSYLYDLASLITKDDRVIARERAWEASTDEVWMSLRFLAGHWWWVDQEAMLYQDIESCPTERSCGIMGKTGTANLVARDCQERRNFMCLKKF